MHGTIGRTPFAQKADPVHSGFKLTKGLLFASIQTLRQASAFVAGF